MNEDFQMLKAYVFMMDKYLLGWEKDYERAHLSAGVAKTLLNNIIEDLEERLGRNNV